MSQNYCLTKHCLRNTVMRNAGEISGKWRTYLQWTQCPLNICLKSMLFLLPSWISILEFYSTWIKRVLVNSRLTPFWVIILSVCDSPPLPSQGGIKVLVSLHRTLALGPDIWFSSRNSPHSYQLWFTQCCLLLSCCFSSLKCLPLHMTPQPHVHTTATARSPPLDWKTPSCQPALS